MTKTIWTGALGVAVLCMLSLGCYSEGGAATATESMEKTLPLAANGSFRLENVNGSITLTSWDRAEVYVKAVKKSRGLTQEKAKEALAKTEVVIKGTEGEVSVETVHPKNKGVIFGGAPVSVEYDIRVPKGARASLTTVNGAVSADADGSDLTCQSVNGTLTVKAAGVLHAESVNGRVDFRAATVEHVETTNGSVEGVLDGPQTGAGRVETVNGSVRLGIGPGASMTVVAENTNGSIDCTFPGFQVEKHRVTGTVGAGGPSMEVTTVNGSITLAPASKS